VVVATGSEPALVARAEAARPPGAPSIEGLERRELEKLLPNGAVHQGIAILAPPLEQPELDDVLRGLAGKPSALIVVLDQATDPRNVGAVLRSAAAFAADAVVLQERHAPEATAALAKAASGALELVPLARVINLTRALEDLKREGFWCIGLDGQASQAIAEIDLSGRVVLVLGSEGGGLRRLVREGCDLLARVPIAPGVESLNLSAAASVALYEVARRRA
jgi:23S rRNA (guanosine2251-2'-O)-methyltransferase